MKGIKGLKSPIIEHERESSTKESVTPVEKDRHSPLLNNNSRFPSHRITTTNEKSDFNKTLDFFNTAQDFHSGIRRGFGKYSRRLIFFLIFLTNVMINFDHGALPAATTNLMKELNLDPLSLGMLGSVVFLGLTFGACAAGIIFNTYAPKWIVTISLVCSCFFLYLFTQAETLLSLAGYRFSCGFFQIFGMIYFPVWIDQFGVLESRTMWLAYLQLGVPLGTMLGYVTEAFSIRVYSTWKTAFYLQILLLGTAAIAISLTPDKFFSKYYRRTDLTRKLKSQLLQGHNNEENLTLGKNMIINGPKYSRLSDFSIYSLRDEEEENKETNYLEILSSLVANKTYTFTMLTICCLLFIITGIQFWISDYMKVVMNIGERKVYITFASVCITAPTLGVLSGGYIIEQLGGYSDKRALHSCYQIAIMAAACGLPLPLIDNFPIFVLLMWLTLFFGGSIVPGLTGIMLSTIPAEYKEIANSHTHFCYNLIGYLPAPFIYGLVSKYFGGRCALAILTTTSLLGVLFLRYAKKYQTKAQIEIINQNSELYETYLNEKKFTETKTDPLNKTQAITALYGRISLNHSS